MNRLENIKRDEIRYFSDYEWFPNWETFLTSNYWKAWRLKIPSFQTEEELCFYTQRLTEIADAIRRYKKYGSRGKNTDFLISSEEKRLQNISLEDWKEEYKFASVKIDEMTTEEIIKKFGDLGEKLVKGEISKKIDKSVNYGDWNEEELTKEFIELGSLINELKKTENLDQTQRMSRKIISKKLEMKHREIEFFLNRCQNRPINNKNDSPIIPFFIIIGVIILLLGFIAYKHNKKKH